MPEEQKYNFAKLYVQLFLLVNIIILPIGLFLLVGLTNSSSGEGSMGIFLIVVAAFVCVVQPFIGIPVSICYLMNYKWAKKAIVGILSILLVSGSILAIDFGASIFLFIWILIAALIILGIILIFHQMADESNREYWDNWNAPPPD